MFDRGSAPSSPSSADGVAWAEYISGIPIAGLFESVPWPDSHNLGDTFLVETVLFAGIPPVGGKTIWHDDTDVIAAVPEAGTWTLCALDLRARGSGNDLLQSNDGPDNSD